jgi:tetratricopeptide (TPR) repeat protein
MCKALVFISQKMYLEANKELNYLINFLEKSLEDDDKTGKGTLAAAYANRGIIKDRNKNYEEALKDYVKALGIDHESVAGPGLGTIILNYKFKSSSVKERALYLNEQLQLPENERVLSIKELDEGQVMHKPSKL